MENSILKKFGSVDVKITPDFCSYVEFMQFFKKNREILSGASWAQPAHSAETETEIDFYWRISNYRKLVNSHGAVKDPHDQSS